MSGHFLMLCCWDNVAGILMSICARVPLWEFLRGFHDNISMFPGGLCRGCSLAVKSGFPLLGSSWSMARLPSSVRLVDILAVLHVPWLKSIYAYREGCLLCPVLGSACDCLCHPFSLFHPLKKESLWSLYIWDSNFWQLFDGLCLALLSWIWCPLRLLWDAYFKKKVFPQHLSWKSSLIFSSESFSFPTVCLMCGW